MVSSQTNDSKNSLYIAFALVILGFFVILNGYYSLRGNLMEQQQINQQIQKELDEQAKPCQTEDLIHPEKSAACKDEDPKTPGIQQDGKTVVPAPASSSTPSSSGGSTTSGGNGGNGGSGGGGGGGSDGGGTEKMCIVDILGLCL